MSNLRHRQPVWRWSVVLLSTALLLSPAAARALLGALSAAQQAAAVVAEIPRRDAATVAESTTSPRRSEEEDTAALFAALDLFGQGMAEEEAPEGELSRYGSESSAALTRTFPPIPAAKIAPLAAADTPLPSTLAVLVPARGVVLVPDDEPGLPCAFVSAGRVAQRMRRAASEPESPRGPPSVSLCV